MDAINRDRFEIVPFGITKDGRWIAGRDPLRALETAAQKLPALATGYPVRRAALLGEPGHGALMDVATTSKHSLVLSAVERLDVILPILHGPYGEDGTVQGLLELAGLPYVGAGVVGSAVAMDKGLFKKVMQAEGIPILPYVVVLRSDWEHSPGVTLDMLEERLHFPIFTKPANLGSSVGINRCANRRQLAVGLDEAGRFDRRLVVEQGIEAREIEVSVLGNDNPIASIAGEILPGREFYSYQAKYLDHGEDASRLLIPAPISAELMDHAQRWAVQAYRAIDCAGMARVDFLLDRYSGALYLNEMNTIPGFTAISMYPKLWEASGLTYSELIERLIDLALERHEDRARTLTSYDRGAEA
jgi:D-alanine-D-alanine ligase